MQQDYTVTIHYREPSYEQTGKPRAEPYRFTYDVHAEGADRARELAIAEFERVTRESSVGWVREIVEVEVAIVEDKDGDLPSRRGRP